MSISSHLITWYRSNHRPLPWRETTDPYCIWLSEVILQQTRVDQGLPYYQRFIESYPTISDLASAPDDQVMKLWQGLGYYSRARNLLAAARLVRDKYNGIFPSDYLHIRKLPGIGDYTAAAVASFAFDLPHAVVDGNVSRVLARLFGIETPVDSPKGKKIIAEIAREELNLKNPAIHNQAIMEFGAVLCKPARPLCQSCFLKFQCEAFINGKVGTLPLKMKKSAIRNRYFNYLLIRYKESIYLRKRGAGDIWHNLFELPLIETENSLPADQIMASGEWNDLLGKQQAVIQSVTENKVHKLSHQHIHTRVFDIRLDRQPGTRLRTAFLRVPAQEVVNYAVPRIIENILEDRMADYKSV